MNRDGTRRRSIRFGRVDHRSRRTGKTTTTFVKEWGSGRLLASVVLLGDKAEAYLRESNGAMDAHAGSVSKERLQLENGEQYKYRDKWAKRAWWSGDGMFECLC